MWDPDEEHIIAEREGRDRDRYSIAEVGDRSQLNFQDLTLKEEVGEALGFLEDVDASQVEVEARNGVITLSGTVMTEREKDEAEDCALDIDGVLTVINDLTVQTTSSR